MKSINKSTILNCYLSDSNAQPIYLIFIGNKMLRSKTLIYFSKSDSMSTIAISKIVHA